MDESALKTLLDNLEISRASLHGWLHFWTFLVVVGVALEVVFVVWEYVRELHDFRRGEVHPPERPSLFLLVLGLLGAGLVAVGVAGELYIDVKASKVETDIRNANELRVSLLSKEAGDAKDSAQTARDAAKEAKSQSDQAQSGAANALTLAQEARKEADSFEQGIASAKKHAADAESHLADAMNRANALTAQLNRITTSRTLPASPELISSLRVFKGTEYMFVGVCGDTECINLLKDIDKVLGLAEWKRVKAPHVFPGIVLWGKREDDDGAGLDFEPGTKVAADVTQQGIEQKPLSELPQYLRAAVALNLSLASNISPSENVGRLVDITPGSSTVVRISVGRKPLP